jgi:hypothetical protein
MTPSTALVEASGSPINPIGKIKFVRNFFL